MRLLILLNVFEGEERERKKERGRDRGGNKLTFPLLSLF